MKVIIIGPNPDDPSRNGGVAKYMQYLKAINHSKSNQFDQHYLFTDVAWFSGLGLLSIGRLFSSFLIAYKILFAQRESIIHLNVTLSKGGGFRLLPIYFAASIKRLPVLIQIHGGRWSNVNNNVITRNLWLFIFKLSNHIGCFSGPQYQELCKVYALKGKLSTLANFVPDNNFNSVNNSVFTFVFLGRILRSKGIFEILEATTQLNQTHPNLKFLVKFIGSGPDFEELKLHESECIEVLGRKSGEDLFELMSSANSLVLPSYYPEGFPLVFLEAAQFALAPIITENSAIVDYFEADKEYISVQPKSSIELAKCMHKLLTETSFTAGIGQQLKERVKKDFSTNSESISNQYVNIYKKTKGIL